MNSFSPTDKTLSPQIIIPLRKFVNTTAEFPL